MVITHVMVADMAYPLTEGKFTFDGKTYEVVATEVGAAVAKPGIVTHVFTPGDRVQMTVADHEGMWGVGDNAVVIQRDDRSYQLDFNNAGNEKVMGNGIWWASKVQMVPYPDEHEKHEAWMAGTGNTEARAFKVGDRVVVRPGEDCARFYKAGDFGVVIAVHPSGYDVDFSNAGNANVYKAGQWFVDEDTIEKA